MNQSTPLIIGIFFILLGIIIGAFGAHMLSDLIDDRSTEILDISTDYLFYQGIGMIAIYLVFKQRPFKYKKSIVAILALGTILFSGSLVLIAVRTIFPTLPMSLIGPLTPIGGILMIVAWAILLYESIKRRKL